MINRRQALAIGVTLMTAAAHAQQTNTTPVIKLPAPSGDGELMRALRARKSSRAFAPRPLPRETLGNLLWAAFGINRPQSGGRTAPSAHNWQEIDVYAAFADGAYRYDARAHALTPVVAKDVRALTGVQDFVATAPLNLVYVADFARMADASAEDRLYFAPADAGVIAQNVYLFCAANGLAAVVRGLVNRKDLAPALSLRREQRIILAQSVGFPAG